MCGQVRGYQFCSPDVFYSLNVGINSYHVDGISITYGHYPHTHIWTYAGGLREDRLEIHDNLCNIGYSGGKDVASSFVGNHYYCESGFDPGKNWTSVLYTNDTL